MSHDPTLCERCGERPAVACSADCAACQCVPPPLCVVCRDAKQPLADDKPVGTRTYHETLKED